MRSREWFIVLLCIVCQIVWTASTARAAENPKNRIDYWQSNFKELSPENDTRARKAHKIFERILDAAGRRPGVVPRLFIIDNKSDFIPLAFAIPDGTIIISQRILNICYADPKRGDDRLAFILGHEIAHQLKDDFWHQRFFQAVELSKAKNPADTQVLDEVKQAAQLTDKVLAKEIEADEHGIIYTAMAGFNTNAIITEDEKVNFFEYVAQAMDPEHIKGFHKDPTHPSPKQRANTIKARLKQVLEKVALYDTGILFYESGDYERAILFFSEFLRFFPSREVYHNLATCHHQLALKYYRMWKKDDPAILFKLSLAIDPTTRAKQINLRGAINPKTLFEKNIQQAIKYYQSAISQDPAYFLAYNNLGCALIVHGEVYKAIGLFKDASKLDFKSPVARNNLGVAFYLIENPAKAMVNLTAATQLDPDYAAPYFNMGKIAYSENKPSQAEQYWMAYLKIDDHSPWADAVRAALSLKKSPPKTMASSTKQTPMELKVGDYSDDIPTEWGKPIHKWEYHLKEEPFKITQFRNGYTIISQDDEILVISARLDCRGITPKGIGIGTDIDKVVAFYGPPDAEMELSKRLCWLYPSQGISFVFQGKKVSVWTMY